MGFTVTSTAFAAGMPIPVAYTEDGANRSPPLAWSGAPAGTREFAVVCDDPDAPTAEPWVHWVACKVAADVASLPEGISGKPGGTAPSPMLEGKNSWTSGRTVGYRGPAPPRGHGVHHYRFQVFALDEELRLAAGFTKQQLQDAMEGHILARGELVGVYER